MSQPTGYPVDSPEPFTVFVRRQPEESEMSWGLGLTPRGLEHAPPWAGGRYHGCAPEPPTIVRVDFDPRA